MASTSNHYGDVVNWIEKVIDSCEHPLQEVTARKLVRQFEEQYRDIDQQLGWGLSRRLRQKLDNKIYSRIENQLEQKN